MSNKELANLETLMWVKLIKFVSKLKKQESNDWDHRNKYK